MTAVNERAARYVILGSEDDEKMVASNVTERIRALQALLQFIPGSDGSLPDWRDSQPDFVERETRRLAAAARKHAAGYDQVPQADPFATVGAGGAAGPTGGVDIELGPPGQRDRGETMVSFMSDLVRGGKGGAPNPNNGGVLPLDAEPAPAPQTPARPAALMIPGTGASSGGGPNASPQSPVTPSGSATPPPGADGGGIDAKDSPNSPNDGGNGGGDRYSTATLRLALAPGGGELKAEASAGGEDGSSDPFSAQGRVAGTTAGTSPSNKAREKVKPLVEGTLYMQKTTGKWKKLWCSYAEGILTYRSEEQQANGQPPKKRAIGGFRVAFIEAEDPKLEPQAGQTKPVVASGSRDFKDTASSSPTHAREPPLSPKNKDKASAAGAGAAGAAAAAGANGAGSGAAGGAGAAGGSAGGPAVGGSGAGPAVGTAGSGENKQLDDLTASQLETNQAPNALKLFSPHRIYMFRADTADQRDKFVAAITADLKARFPEDLWADKVEALKEVNPLLREQFLVQVQRYQALVKALAKSGFMEDDLPITSTRKEKSGVLCMETPSELTKWRDYYFVLFEGCLFYYKDSKSTTPTGFITLRYASVHLDSKRLAKGDFVFVVKTPLRTVVCKTRHAVALSEWISCLETTLANANAAPGKQQKRAGRSSEKVLHEIQRLQGDVSSLQALIQHSVGLQYFRKYVVEEAKGSASDLDFFVRAEEYRGDDVLPQELPVRAKGIYDLFFRDESKERIDVPKQIKADIEAKLAEAGVPTAALFKDAVKVVQTRLSTHFNHFRKTETYRNLEHVLAIRNPPGEKRDVGDFPPGMQQMFVLKVKGQKRSKEILLKKKDKIFTIGRDKSNTLVIEDSRVSRSHARVEYTDNRCEYIDLGSSCGSKLNGKPVQRAKLQPGDVIELGQSTLIFQLKKKKRFGLFGGN